MPLSAVSCKPTHLKASQNDSSAQAPEPPELSMSPQGATDHRGWVGMDGVFIFTARLLEGDMLHKEQGGGRKVILPVMTSPRVDVRNTQQMVTHSTAL